MADYPAGGTPPEINTSTGVAQHPNTGGGTIGDNAAFGSLALIAGLIIVGYARIRRHFATR